MRCDSCRLAVVEGKANDTCADGGHCKRGLAGNPPVAIGCCWPGMLRPSRLLFAMSHMNWCVFGWCRAVGWGRGSEGEEPRKLMDGVVFDSVALGACDGEYAWAVGERRWGTDKEGCAVSADMLTLSVIGGTGEPAWCTSMSSWSAGGLREELWCLFPFDCVPLGVTMMCV